MKKDERREFTARAFRILGRTLVSRENEYTEKSTRLLCDDARRHIAEVLPSLVDKIVARALGKNPDDKDTDPSLPHAKFIVDLAESLGVWKHDDKRPKPVDEPPAAPPAPDPALEFLQSFMKKLDERTVRSPEHNSSAVE